jgi:urease accessory protein
MAPHVKKLAAAVSALVAMASASPAFAHHLMGGELPHTAWQGLLSGLGHPIIGIDHFAFTVGVGLMAYLAGRLVLLPLLFVAGSVIGCFIHIQGLDIPWSEAGIALTVVAAAAIVATRSALPAVVLAVLFAAAGVLHGYAYGESIVGAEAAPLGAYIVGFALIQYGIAVGSGLVLRMLTSRHLASEAMIMRLAGVGIALVAAFAFVNVAMAS